MSDSRHDDQAFNIGYQPIGIVAIGVCATGQEACCRVVHHRRHLAETWRVRTEDQRCQFSRYIHHISSCQRLIAANAFTDPSIIGVDGVWYAFATRTKGTTQHIQVAQSTDYATWTLVKNSDGSQKEALPNLPSWVDTSSATSSNVWAPDVSRLVCVGLDSSQ